MAGPGGAAANLVGCADHRTGQCKCTGRLVGPTDELQPRLGLWDMTSPGYENHSPNSSVAPTNSAGRSAGPTCSTGRPTRPTGRGRSIATAATANIVGCHRRCNLHLSARPTTIPPAFCQGTLDPRHVAEFHAPQADRGPEEASSLVTLARRSQPGQEGDVNSQILKTLTTSTSRDLGVDIPLLVWLPWDDWVTREAEADRPRTPPRCYRSLPDQALSPRSPARRRPAVRSRQLRSHLAPANHQPPTTNHQPPTRTSLHTKLSDPPARTLVDEVDISAGVGI